MRTWLKANRSARRRAMRYEACRPILAQVMAAGFFAGDRVPFLWRSLCGVERDGSPRPDSPALPVVPAPAAT